MTDGEFPTWADAESADLKTLLRWRTSLPLARNSDEAEIVMRMGERLEEFAEQDPEMYAATQAELDEEPLPEN